MMEGINLLSYDKYLVQFSGGKDSTAVVLYLLGQGVPKSKIELWHQLIDGPEKTFFDWEITPDYCRKFAAAFGLNIYFQWREGGFRREMMRENARTAPIHFELPDGSIGESGGIRGKLSTRLKFPQCSASLQTRWCSSSLKIDVCSSAIINQERFRSLRTLVLSGERAEESPQRAKYAVFGPDRADLRSGKGFSRHVDRYRPLLHWKETEVWNIIKRHRIRVHPCYYMGWTRCSCKFCIFSQKNQYASAAKISPQQTGNIIQLETRFCCTIKRNITLRKFIDSGTAYKSITSDLQKLATGFNYNRPIILPHSEEWILPAGAYGENCGPA
ncbi:phosphoadenosine phosphosulfate reductase family protein [Bacteroides fragilis]|nr:phosphoadenosine phosphosulfate reductase family protein [Bacteroides fragilis]